MTHENKVVITLSAFYIVLFGGAMTSAVWLGGDGDLGTGIVVISVFISLHLALTVALVVATLKSVWSLVLVDHSRTPTNVAVASGGGILCLAALAYIAFFFTDI